MSGAVAGAIAAAVTNPLDVCKTLLNTQVVILSTFIVTGQNQIRAFFTPEYSFFFIKSDPDIMLFQPP